jgi:hypothetical protein
MSVKRFTSDELRPASPESWMWCIECNRFFQAKHLRKDFLGNRQRCAFCGVAGFGVAIWPWDAWQADGWPTSEAELRHGLIQR